MACPFMKEKLSEYLDGTLPAEDREYVEEHLASCEDCSRTLAELKATLERLGTLGEVQPPPWFAEKVMRDVREGAGKNGILRWLFYPLHIKLPAEALAVALVAVVSVYLFHAMSPEMSVKQAAVAEKQDVVTEQPEAGFAATDAFSLPEDENAQPFAPAGAETSTEDEGLANEEIMEPSPEVAAPQMRIEREKQTLSEQAKVADSEFKTHEHANLLKDKQITGEYKGEAPAEKGMVLKKEASETMTEATAPDARFSVVVEDEAFARHEIESAIMELGGKIITREGEPDNVMWCELAADELDNLVEHVKQAGEVKDFKYEAAGERISVEIELLEEEAAP